MIQTARLFPNKRTAKPDINKLASKVQPIVRSITNSASRERLAPPHRSLSLDRLNESIRSLQSQNKCVKHQLMRLSDSNLNRSHFSPSHSIELNTFKSPAFKHFLSPKMNRGSPILRPCRSASTSPARHQNAGPRTSSANDGRSISPILKPRVRSRSSDHLNDSLSDQLFRLRLKQESELEDLRARYKMEKQKLASKSLNKYFNPYSNEAIHQYQLPSRPRQGNLLFAYDGAPKTTNLYTRLTMLRVRQKKIEDYSLLFSKYKEPIFLSSRMKMTE